MKTLFLIFLILAATCSQAQDIKKIVESGKPAKFEKFISKGGDLNQEIEIINSYGVTMKMDLLTFIIGQNEKEMFDIYLDQIDDITNKDEVIASAFVFSLSKEDEHYAEKLYELNPDLKGTCNICHGNNAILTAATHGKLDWYLKLKEQSDLMYVNSSGATLLHGAASGENMEILEDVLAIEGIKKYLDQADNTGLTPLDYAMQLRDPAMAIFLIEQKADPLKSKNLFYSASFYANEALFWTDYISNIEPKAFEEVWWCDEDGLPALDMATIWDEEFSVELLDEGKMDQIRFIQTCIRYMSFSFDDEDFDACAAYEKIKGNKDLITADVWDYSINYYNYVYTYLSDHDEAGNLESGFEELLLDMADLHRKIQKNCNDKFISAKSYKKLTKNFGEDYINDLFTEEGNLIELGE